MATNHKKTASTKKRKNASKKDMPVKTNKYTLEICSVITVALALFIEVSLFSESTGIAGTFLRNVFLGLFSYTAYFLPILILVIATNLMIEKSLIRHYKKYLTIGAVLLIVGALCQYSSSQELSGNVVSALYANGCKGIGGGVVGGLINLGLQTVMGRAGTMIVYIAGLCICCILLFHLSVLQIARSLFQHFSAFLEKSRKAKETEPVPEQDEPPVIIASTPLEEDAEEELSPEEDIVIGPDFPILPETNDEVFPDHIIENDNQVAINTEQGAEDFVHEGSGEYIENYVFPPLDLLSPAKKNGKSVKEQDLMKNARKLVDTLASFGVQAKILQVTKGPAITRYELQPMAGVKVSKIVNLADDIALNLAAQGVRIEAPIPGKAAIGIEVPNLNIDMVSMREVIESSEFKNHPSKLAVALGKDISGSPVVIDLAKMPHLLIAGATGSGKSVCINSIITSIMYKANPNEVKLLLIDPKVVELSAYNGIPHLDTPVVTKAKKAAGALNWAVVEMMKRYDMFSESKVRDIKGYNEAAAKHGYPLLPQIVIIIDELADLMMVAPNEVEDSICRIAQLARAAGMHLVIATQRPSVNVITGIIKANIPSRIAFAVSSQVDSRTILDSAGAEKLLGKGDMLYSPVGSSKPKRIQGAFISDEERQEIIEFVKSNTEATYNPEIAEHIEREQVSDKEKAESAGDNDELLPKAIDIVMEAGQASTSMIQRKLSVGFSRAGRIIDQMEQRGIIGPSQGSKPREILLTKDQYLELKASGIFSEPIKY